MPSPGKLIEVTARALEIPEVTVGSYYRVLREAGLLTKSGRGRSAAETTTLDAARLLIGIMASPRVKTAAERTLLFSQFRSVNSRSRNDVAAVVEMDELDPYPALDASVAALINYAGECRLVNQRIEQGEDIPQLETTFYALSISQKSLQAVIDCVIGTEPLRLLYVHEADSERGPGSEDEAGNEEYAALSSGANYGLQPVMQVEEDVIYGIAAAFV